MELWLRLWAGVLARTARESTGVVDMGARMRGRSTVGRPHRALAFLGVLFTACSWPTSSSVDKIVDANLAARGGKDRLQALRSVRQTGTITASDGRVARIVREIQRPGLFRLEFTYQG